MNEELFLKDEITIDDLNIPSFTYADFETEKPYSYLKSISDSFTKSAITLRVRDNAKKVGFSPVDFKAQAKAFEARYKKERTLNGDNYTNFLTQPCQLFSGKYICNESGIYYYDKLGNAIEVCLHPIMPIRVMTNIDTGACKVEIAFRKPYKTAWSKQVIDRMVLASSQQILSLAMLNISVDSDNAKELCKFFTFMLNANDEQLGNIKSVSRLGWISHDAFVPYVDNINFDGEQSYCRMFEAVKPKGDAQLWVKAISEAREESLIFKIMLAASLASPLVQPLDCLPFFLHVWGGTEAGKTVGLMAAASVWADPTAGEYIQTFNSTAVSQELIAGFCNSLPLCVDELQIIKDRQSFDKLVYMLTEGQGKSRGTKSGGVQKLATWRNVILTTGEQPISKGNSGGGAMNRIIEIDCKSEKLFKNPRAMVALIRENFGGFGRLYIETIKKDIPNLKALYEEIYHELLQGESTEKQSMAAALILTADNYVSNIFGWNPLQIKELEQYLVSKAEIDVNARALNYIYNTISENAVHFVTDNPEEAVPNIAIWGKISGGNIFINHAVFSRIMQEAGFSEESFLSWAKNNGTCSRCDDKRNTVRTRINGKLTQCICIAEPIENAELFANEEIPF